MIPPPIIEAALWLHLNQHRSIELILLKGHLLLEVVIDQALDNSDNILNGKNRDISFSKKISALQKKTMNPNQTYHRAIEHTKLLNKLRNRLAHDPFFANGIADLDKWAQAVLQDVPHAKVVRYTPRTRTVQAIAALGKVLLEQRTAP
jgi:hypothetical protein